MQHAAAQRSTANTAGQPGWINFTCTHVNPPGQQMQCSPGLQQHRKPHWTTLSRPCSRMRSPRTMSFSLALRYRLPLQKPCTCFGTFFEICHSSHHYLYHKSLMTSIVSHQNMMANISATGVAYGNDQNLIVHGVWFTLVSMDGSVSSPCCKITLHVPNAPGRVDIQKMFLSRIRVRQCRAHKHELQGAGCLRALNGIKT